MERINRIVDHNRAYRDFSRRDYLDAYVNDPEEEPEVREQYLRAIRRNAAFNRLRRWRPRRRPSLARMATLVGIRRGLPPGLPGVLGSYFR